MGSPSKKNHTLMTAFVVLFFFAGLSWFIADRIMILPTKEKVLKIKDAAIIVEIADTPGKQEKGLSGRSSLDENRGMLFTFSEPGYYSFWMKDMLIPLDFIWINKNQVVQVDENIKPEDYPPPKFFTPKYPADSVLEVNAGIVKKFGINPGDKINL